MTDLPPFTFDPNKLSLKTMVAILAATGCESYPDLLQKLVTMDLATIEKMAEAQGHEATMSEVMDALPMWAAQVETMANSVGKVMSRVSEQVGSAGLPSSTASDPASSTS